VWYQISAVSLHSMDHYTQCARNIWYNVSVVFSGAAIWCMVAGWFVSIIQMR